MKIQNITNINEIDKTKVLRLIEASIQAYKAFDSDEPEVCQVNKIIPPEGFEFIDSWSGYDSIRGVDKHAEVYGVVFRSQKSPENYIFAFRGTTGTYDILDDLGVEKKAFVAHAGNVPSGVEVESGFFDIYSVSTGEIPSMQQQLFQLIDKYAIQQLSITGHSLGSALSEIFTLDIALSRPDVKTSTINYACPRVGNNEFVTFYEKQAAQQDPKTRTLRVVNTEDKVPCGPPESLGYKHASGAYFISFYEDGGIEERYFDLLARHKAYNYQAVLMCAAESADGFCVSSGIVVHASSDSITSQKPDPDYAYDIL